MITKLVTQRIIKETENTGRSHHLYLVNSVYDSWVSLKGQKVLIQEAFYVEWITKLLDLQIDGA